MPMMGVRVVWVRVIERRVLVGMRVFSRHWLAIRMCMLVVRVVHMYMVVFHGFVGMVVHVPLGQVQPHAQSH